MTGTTDHADFSDSLGNPFFLGRQRKTIVVVDMVESVRLIAQDEASVVTRWKQFTQRVRSETLPPLGGMLVKSLGDGMMLTFPDARNAVSAAQQVRRLMDDVNRETLVLNPQAEQIMLRTGIHSGEVVSDDIDIYGHSANLAARITTLGGPGEIIVSAEVRDHLTDGLDGELEDLGECYLKHLAQPVRVYRVGSAGSEPVLPARKSYAISLQPTIAVIPFSAQSGEADGKVLGDVLADDTISALSRVPALKVISRLSSAVFRDRIVSMEEIGRRLGSTYVISGSFRSFSGAVRVIVELSDTRSGQVVWSGSLRASVNAILAGDSEAVSELIAAIGKAVLGHELKRAQAFPLPSLESYTLLMGAISLMHRTQASDFQKSRSMLEHLVARHSHSPLPLAWLAKWQVLEVVQGWSANRDKAGVLALAAANKALQCDPECSLALAVEGLVHTYLLGDLERGGRSYDAALEINPNESLAWLFKSTWQSYRDQPEEAAQSGELALQLSPLDPLGYFYDSLVATAMTSARRYDRAIELARKSLRANRTHASTHRILTIALTLKGDQVQAQDAAKDLMAIEPNLTGRAFLARYPGRTAKHADLYADALVRAGVPK